MMRLKSAWCLGRWGPGDFCSELFKHGKASCPEDTQPSSTTSQVPRVGNWLVSYSFSLVLAKHQSYVMTFSNTCTLGDMGEGYIFHIAESEGPLPAFAAWCRLLAASHTLFQAIPSALCYRAQWTDDLPARVQLFK